MQTFKNFLHQVTGLEQNTVAPLTPHFKNRLAYLGGIMLLTAFTNAALLTVSLYLNGYHFLASVISGGGALLFTYSIERFIVTSTKPLSSSSVLYRTLLFLVMVGVHLIFVDLAFYRADLIPVAREYNDRKKADMAVRYEKDLFETRQKIALDFTALQALKEEYLKKMKAPTLEGKGALSNLGPGQGPQYWEERRQFKLYDTTFYQPEKAALDLSLGASRSREDTLLAKIEAIKDRPLAYNEIGLTTKLAYLHHFASRPGNGSVPIVMLIIVLAVAVIEFAPLYARHRLEFSEYRLAYQHARQLREVAATENTRAETFAAELRGEAMRVAALAAQAGKLAERQAEDRFNFAMAQADFIHRAEAKQLVALQGLSTSNQERINNVFSELIEDLFEIFRKARTTSQTQ